MRGCSEAFPAKGPVACPCRLLRALSQLDNTLMLSNPSNLTTTTPHTHSWLCRPELEHPNLVRVLHCAVERPTLADDGQDGATLACCGQGQAEEWCEGLLDECFNELSGSWREDATLGWCAALRYKHLQVGPVPAGWRIRRRQCCRTLLAARAGASTVAAGGGPGCRRRPSSCGQARLCHAG